jgi:hypothetical protein
MNAQKRNNVQLLCNFDRGIFATTWVLHVL